jgi:hypothetical protein
MTTNQLGTPQSYLGNIIFGGPTYMPAIIHFTQTPRDGGSGQSAIGFVIGDPVTMTDDGGPGATSYLWEILNWPASLASAPVITNETSQIATVTPSMDGTFLVKLTRVDGGITTTDMRFFSVADADGLSLPTAGITGRMANIGATPLLAQAAGWMGRADAGTNVMLDAYLRWVKDAAKNSQTFPIVSGSQTWNLNTFLRIGTLSLDPTKYPGFTTAKFQAIIEATGTKTAEIQLYNSTDGGIVAGSVLSAPATAPTLVEATVTLPSALKTYEVHLRMTTVDAPNLDSGTCTSARILLAW